MLHVLSEILLWTIINIWCVISSMCIKWNLPPVHLRWPSLQTKKGQRLRHFISTVTKIIERIRHRQYDPGINEKTIGIVLGPSTAMCGLHCTLSNKFKATGTKWRALSNPPQRRQGNELWALWLSFSPLYRHSGSFMVDAWILVCDMKFWPLTSCGDFPTNQISTNLVTLIPSFTFTELRVVSMEHLQREWHARRERWPFLISGSAPLLMLQLLRQVFPNLPCLFSTVYLGYTSVLSLFCLVWNPTLLGPSHACSWTEQSLILRMSL